LGSNFVAARLNGMENGHQTSGNLDNVDFGLTAGRNRHMGEFMKVSGKWA